jgi:hypothetical protein
MYFSFVAIVLLVEPAIRFEHLMLLSAYFLSCNPRKKQIIELQVMKLACVVFGGCD